MFVLQRGQMPRTGYISGLKRTDMKTMLLVYSSRSAALDAKANLERAGIYSRAVSTPRSLSRSCGISLQVNGVPYGTLRGLAGGAAVYYGSDGGWTRYYV